MRAVRHMLFAGSPSERRRFALCTFANGEHIPLTLGEHITNGYRSISLAKGAYHDFKEVYIPLAKGENTLVRPLQSFEQLDGGLHLILTEERIEIVYESLDLIADKREVQALELSEHLGRKDMVDTADDVSAAGNVNGNEGLELLHNTVTECNSELLDNVKIERLDHIEIHLINGMLGDSLIVKSIDRGESDL